MPDSICGEITREEYKQINRNRYNPVFKLLLGPTPEEIRISQLQQRCKPWPEEMQGPRPEWLRAQRERIHRIKTRSARGLVYKAWRQRQTKESRLRAKEKMREWHKNNRERVNSANRVNGSRYRSELTDAFVKWTLARRTNLSAKDIPPDLVPTARELIRLKRLLKQKN